MKYRYPSILSFSEEEKEIINVSFPDIFGAYTFGYSLEEALKNAKEVLMLYVKSEKKINPPSEIHKIEKKFPEAIVEIVEVSYEN